MKNNDIIMILLSVLCISLAISFSEIGVNKHISVQSFAKTISAISSLFTLYLALKIYQKYRIDESIVNKQADTILSFLQDLQKVQFFIVKAIGKKKGKYGETFYLSPIQIIDSKIFTSFEEIYSDILVFDGNYYEEIEKVMSYRWNIFMPKEIVLKLKSIGLKNKKKIKRKWNKGYSHLYSPQVNYEFDMGIRPSYHADYNTYINGEINYTVLNYLEEWEALISSCEEWLDKHSTKKNRLNYI